MIINGKGVVDHVAFAHMRQPRLKGVVAKTRPKGGLAQVGGTFE
jgi:hypothetical protein